MQRFTIHTLIDITETRQFKHLPGADLAKSQQQNFSMLLQTIGLRVNPLYERAPRIEEVNLKDYHFGSKFKGTHKMWTFNFAIEFDGGFTDQFGNPAGLLMEDLHFVPMIIELEETAEINIPMFNTKDADYCNTLVYFEDV